VIELTADYRDEHGELILPELIAWDGETNQWGFSRQEMQQLGFLKGD
jgi:hypothetical protein